MKVASIAAPNSTGSRLNVPIAFFVFNRPERAAVVFDAIRAVRPRKLLVVGDGPRANHPGEAERCCAVRGIIQKGVDWLCEVETNYADGNLGCKVCVSSGLEWVFSKVPEAIILEDDCLPHPDFFPYCEELLARYRDDTRVMHINGTNVRREHMRGNDSYFFSKYPLPWGWAAWARSWKHYDVAMQGYEAFVRAGGMEAVCRDPLERRHWHAIWSERQYDRRCTWDWQLIYSLWSQNGLAATPCRNLVTNIGTGPDATHTNGDTVFLELPAVPLGSLSHPQNVFGDVDFDKFVFYEFQGGLEQTLTFRLRARWANFHAKAMVSLALRSRIKRLLFRSVRGVGDNVERK